MGNNSGKYAVPKVKEGEEGAAAGKAAIQSTEAAEPQNGTHAADPTIKEEPEKEEQEGATNGEVKTEEKKDEAAIEELPAEKKEDVTDSPSKAPKKRKNPISWLKKNISFRKNAKPKENGSKTDEKKEVKENGVEKKEEGEEKPDAEKTEESTPAVNGDKKEEAPSTEAAPAPSTDTPAEPAAVESS